jgi:ADP-ribose pyrophosphatase YjhB (NUDIX family)
MADDSPSPKVPGEILKASGILFVTPDQRVLLMRRTGRDYAGTWAFPGGGLEAGETAEAAARRETLEETGLDYGGDLAEWTHRIRDGVDFTTYIAARSPEFVPALNDEHDAYQWLERTAVLDLPDLHPGCKIALLRFDLDELGIAKAIRAGELTSPQRYVNLLLIALRITGTGSAYRNADGMDEYVWRDPSIYMNDEFLERCQGLPVIWVHPKTNDNLLDTDEYRERSVGAVMLPYLKPEAQEVWGVARVSDGEIAHILQTEEISTSPGVLVGGKKYRLEDGKPILIEGKPTLIDHIALIPGPGVWDVGGPLAGVESVRADSSTPIYASKLDLAIAKARDWRIHHAYRYGR